MARESELIVLSCRLRRRSNARGEYILVKCFPLHKPLVDRLRVTYMRPLSYRLDDDGTPVPCSTHEAEVALSDERRQIALDTLPGDVRVSTVFLVIDHNWHPSGAPVLWETMIFGGPHDGYQERYTSADDAREGHVRAVARATTPAHP